MDSAPLKPDAPEEEAVRAPDGRLAARIAGTPRGDAAAEREVFRRFAPRVRVFGLRHLRSDSAASDLVQQVLLVTLQALRARRVARPERLGAYVLGVCRRVVSEWRRSDGRQRDWLALETPPLEPEPPRGLDRDRLRDCLRALAERERTVLVLTFYAERRGAEIAAELGLSAGNVRVIRHRALGRLRDCMGLDDDAEGFA